MILISSLSRDVFFLLVFHNTVKSDGNVANTILIHGIDDIMLVRPDGKKT
jgi:hypothetical protein